MQDYQHIMCWLLDDSVLIATDITGFIVSAMDCRDSVSKTHLWSNLGKG